MRIFKASLKSRITIPLCTEYYLNGANGAAFACLLQTGARGKGTEPVRENGIQFRKSFMSKI